MQRILLCDDDEGSGHILEEVLKEHQFQVLRPRSFHQLENIFEQTELQVLIIDLSIPDCDGLELIRLAKQKQIFVIALASMRFLQDQAFAVGADSFLLKPFRIIEILELLRLRPKVIVA